MVEVDHALLIRHDGLVDRVRQDPAWSEMVNSKIRLDDIVLSNGRWIRPASNGYRQMEGYRTIMLIWEMTGEPWPLDLAFALITSSDGTRIMTCGTHF